MRCAGEDPSSRRGRRFRRRERTGALEIREAVAALPEPLQQVLLLRYLLGLSEAEAAEALGIRVGTVKSRTARARTAFMEVWR